MCTHPTKLHKQLEPTKHSMKQPTLLWHDYETWGANPRYDRPAQFAAIRTDEDLNEIGKPIELFCQLADDYLPSPTACLITGITPQIAQAKGMPEVEFIKRIDALFREPGTCGVGYNTIRFDDEVTRNTLYRNLLDPYAREWQNGNSRWDIIDMVRTCYALRPEGIEWPLREDGAPSFKLEHLTAANGISHEGAHDAVADVRATIALARLIKQKQPKLFDYLYQHRSKRDVAKLIDTASLTPLLHVSSKIPAAQGCASWILPLAYHSGNRNAVICVTLGTDPQFLQDLSAEQIREALFTRSDDPAFQRPPIKQVRLNACPVLAPAKMLTPENAERLGIDRDACLAHLSWWKAHPEVRHAVCNAMELPHEQGEAADVDGALYDGFFSDQDRASMAIVHQTAAEALSATDFAFEDPRLKTLLFRFRARNYPHTLSEQEMMRWQAYRLDRLTSGGNPWLDQHSFMAELEQLAAAHQQDSRKMRILQALVQYAQSL